MTARPDQPMVLPVDGPGGGPLYRVTVAWRYEFRVGETVCQLLVPEGFEFDGASIPWWLWSVARIPPDGLHRAAALAHDYLYQHAGVLPRGAQITLTNMGWWPIEHEWTREEADKLFARLLRECGVGQRRRRLMYWAVRAFGWRSWKGKRFRV